MVEKKYTLGWLLRNLVLWFVVFIVAFPILHMVSVSLSGTWDVITNSVGIFPKIDGKVGATLATYKFVLQKPLIFTAYKNTIIYTVLGTAIALFVLSCGAYALSKSDRLPGGKTLNILVLIYFPCVY